MIKIENLDFSYSNKKLFKNLSLELGSGCTGLLGKNGAGKSTLLKIISGQLFFSRGNCSTCGYVPYKRNPLMLEDIFFLPEEFRLPQITAEKYVSINSKFYSKFDYDFFKESMEIFNLDWKTRLDYLSHGQKKKFMISFGYSTMSKIFLLDEPTNGLDIPSKNEFRTLFSEKNAKTRSIIISTHNVKDIENLIDPVVILDDGEIVFKKSLKEISDKLEFVHVKNHNFAENAIYSEKNNNGYLAALEKQGKNDDIFFDFEFIFNMVLSKKKIINQIFGE